MKLLFVRHGDPDYSIDSLTETGWKEAESLSKRLSQLDITEFYLSPLGRAQDTAKKTLQILNREGKTFDWLQEFSPRVDRYDIEGRSCAWDWLPQDWTTVPEFYSYETWANHPLMQEAHVKEEYDYVVQSFDKLLESHGYKHNGNHFEVLQENHDTLCFICHFGLTCVLISHLIHVSPMILWHNFVTAPTSVTLAISEERKKGIASFRINQWGDISHLYHDGMEPSFSARFCECYSDDTRHE